MTLLTDLDAFYLDHRQCGELEAGVDGAVVCFVCDCGASMVRRVANSSAAGLVEC